MVFARPSANDKYEPTPRTEHKTVTVGCSLYMWAGRVNGLPRVHDSTEKRAILSSVDAFRLESGGWVHQQTSGTPPPGVCGYACAVVGDAIHFFGGDCGHEGRCYHNSIHELNTSTLRWELLAPTTSKSRAPMKKTDCGMMAFRNEEDYILFVVGGRGTTPTSWQPGALYESYFGDSVRCNEQHMFTLSTSMSQ